MKEVEEKQRIKEPCLSLVYVVFGVWKERNQEIRLFPLKCFKKINFYLCEAHWLCHQDYASNPIFFFTFLSRFTPRDSIRRYDPGAEEILEQSVE